MKLKKTFHTLLIASKHKQNDSELKNKYYKSEMLKETAKVVSSATQQQYYPDTAEYHQ